MGVAVTGRGDVSDVLRMDARRCHSKKFLEHTGYRLFWTLDTRCCGRGEGYFWMRAILSTPHLPPLLGPATPDLQIPPRVEINPASREPSSFLSRPSRSSSFIRQFSPAITSVDGPFMLVLVFL